MTITRALLIFLLSCSSIALASQASNDSTDVSNVAVSNPVGAEPCALTLRGQVKDPVGCTLYFAERQR